MINDMYCLLYRKNILLQLNNVYKFLFLLKYLTFLKYTSICFPLKPYCYETIGAFRSISCKSNRFNLQNGMLNLNNIYQEHSNPFIFTQVSAQDVGETERWQSRQIVRQTNVIKTFSTILGNVNNWASLMAGLIYAPV